MLGFYRTILPLLSSKKHNNLEISLDIVGYSCRNLILTNNLIKLISMILNDSSIRNLCLHNNLVNPFNECQLNGASYDIRIGDTAQLVTEDGKFDVDLSNTSIDTPYVLMPGACLLVATLEKFNIPNNLAADFKLVSSRGREFFNHMLAGWIDPGYSNSVLTLELINNHPGEAKKIYKGLIIGQVVFMQLTGVATKTYDKEGNYNAATRVESSKKEWQTTIARHNTASMFPRDYIVTNRIV